LEKINQWKRTLPAMASGDIGGQVRFLKTLENESLNGGPGAEAPARWIMEICTVLPYSQKSRA
jgi:hypothetical protein